MGTGNPVPSEEFTGLAGHWILSSGLVQRLVPIPGGPALYVDYIITIAIASNNSNNLAVAVAVATEYLLSSGSGSGNRIFTLLTK